MNRTDPTLHLLAPSPVMFRKRKLVVLGTCPTVRARDVLELAWLEMRTGVVHVFGV
jgi:hypothetical protein